MVKRRGWMPSKFTNRMLILLWILSPKSNTCGLLVYLTFLVAHGTPSDFLFFFFFFMFGVAEFAASQGLVHPPVSSLEGRGSSVTLLHLRQCFLKWIFLNSLSEAPLVLAQTMSSRGSLAWSVSAVHRDVICWRMLHHAGGKHGGNTCLASLRWHQ